MSLTKFTGANLKKMKKDDLITHIIDCYAFIDVFDNSDLIKKLKEENEKLKEQNENWANVMFVATEKLQRKKDILEKEVIDAAEENKQLKDRIVDIEGEKLELQINKDKSVEYLRQAWTKQELFELICDEGLWDEDDDEDDFDVEDWISSIKHQQEENEKLKEEACDYENMRKHRDTLLEESEESFMEIVKLKQLIESIKKETDKAKK